MKRGFDLHYRYIEITTGWPWLQIS